MEISETYWSNFRNLKPRRLSWCSGLNLLTGKNGSGKTNMLEALNIACGWGTFNNASLRELCKWDSEESVTSGNIDIFCEAHGEEKIRSEISISSRVSARINMERVSFSELRAHIPALCFLPGDMNLIDGSPAIRRVFLDKLCSSLSVPYAKRLSDYKRLVRHRIKLLRIGKSPDITSELMSSIGSWIWSVRSSVIKMLNEYILNECSLTLSNFPIKLILKPGGIDGSSDYFSCTPNIIKSKFFERLKLLSEREMKAKVSLAGPHRDDISILVHRGKEVEAGILSRGQKRRAVVSLLLASGRIMESKLKRRPIFFLDEIFSELDEEARQLVAGALFDTGWQIFASSADSTLSNWSGKVYELKEGDVVLSNDCLKRC